MRFYKICIASGFLVGIFSFGYASAQAQQPKQAKQGGGQQMEDKVVKSNAWLDAAVEVGAITKENASDLKKEVQKWASGKKVDKKKVEMVENAVKAKANDENEKIFKKTYDDSIEKQKKEKESLKKQNDRLEELHTFYFKPGADKKAIMEDGISICEDIFKKGQKSWWCNPKKIKSKKS